MSDIFQYAADYALRNSGVNCERIVEVAFKDGAEWQKGQYKEALLALKELVECDYTSGTHLSCAILRGEKALLALGISFSR
jgi:hypothetical protein